MANDAVGGVFVFVEELFRARERYLVDVFFNVLGCHAYAGVADSKCAGFFVNFDLHAHFAKLAFEVTK